MHMFASASYCSCPSLPLISPPPSSYSAYIWLIFILLFERMIFILLTAAACTKRNLFVYLVYFCFCEERKETCSVSQSVKNTCNVMYPKNVYSTLTTVMPHKYRASFQRDGKCHRRKLIHASQSSIAPFGCHVPFRVAGAMITTYSSCCLLPMFSITPTTHRAAGVAGQLCHLKHQLTPVILFSWYRV